MKKNYFALLVALLLAIVSTGCGPTVQDYSDALQGTWTAPLEDSEDGTIERGNVFITFAPIPEGSESSRVTVFYSGHLDATSTYGYSADCTVSVKGTYSIDDTDEKFPLDLRWDINSLDVNVSNVKISDVVQDFQASLEEIVASAYFGISGGSRSSIKKELTKQMKSYCRQQLIERNNDHGWYGLELNDNSFFLVLSNASYKFTRSKGVPSHNN